MLKLMRRGAIVGLLAGGAYAIWRFMASRVPDTGGMTFEPTPFPGLPRPVPTAPASAPTEVPADPPGVPVGTAAATGPWIEPDDGSCPLTHPVKAKLSSGIYHLPGGGNYDRIRAERCYVDADAAIADGLRAPKR